MGVQSTRYLDSQRNGLAIMAPNLPRLPAFGLQTQHQRSHSASREIMIEPDFL